MKKKIVIGIFTALILLTVVAVLVLAIDSYIYDTDPKNGVDVLEGFAAFMLIALGGCVVFYECDLFYTVYYFVARPKTALKSTLHILSHLSLILLGAFISPLSNILPISVRSNSGLVMAILFLLYVILRSACIYAYGEDPVQLPES